MALAGASLPGDCSAGVGQDRINDERTVADCVYRLRTGEKKIPDNEYLTITIEVPEQPNTNRIIARESLNMSGITYGIEVKTTKSFTIIMANKLKNDKTAKITWVLIQCSLPTAEAES